MAAREGQHFPEPMWLKPRYGAFVALPVVVLVTGCLALGSDDSRHAPTTPRAVPTLRQTSTGSASMVGQTTTAGASAHTRSSGASVVSRLSLDELAGQRVIYAYSGLQPPANLLALIREGEAAGVIFFAPNIGNLAQFRTVVDRLQRASLDSALHAPLLMLVDQEGGLVRRLPGAPLQSEKQIGASSDAAGLARDAGRGAGLNLRSVGLNVNLAPVLDVYRQPGNFIDQFQRSYSNNPATTGALGAAFISSQQSIGIGATAKHFPGLGAATHNQNTDLGPVVLDLGRSTLRSVDEYPFRQAIHAGVKLIMLSWATYPALDPKLPAGLSPSIISGELRTRLGFRGVTITDGIDAGAVTPFGSLGTRSLRAAVAGADLILCAATNPNDNSPSIGLSALHALASALADHRLSHTSAEQAAARILALREHQ